MVLLSGCGVFSVWEKGVCGGVSKDVLLWLVLLVRVLVVPVLVLLVLVLLLGMAVTPKVVLDIIMITIVVSIEMSWWFS